MSKPKQSPTMEASGADFLVHTNHTCDSCFQAPILGKRFASKARTNFDLCAACFDAYSGPEIVFAEEALERDKKQSHQFVLKLKIDEGGDDQVRRIKVADVWVKSTARLSFGKLMSLAFRYAASSSAEVDGAGLEAFRAKSKATYIDEDGDKITMTSDDELEDAFRQVFKKNPPTPFRVTVALPKVVERSNEVCVMTKKSGGIKCATRVGKGSCGKFDKDSFIHARHTCDGCSKTPIIGTRYHATKIPDFDLCAMCFEKYEGKGADDFKPEYHDRDRRMQRKWLKKQSNSSQIAGKVAGIWNKANGDLGEFLEQVQASGGIIESATVYAAPPKDMPAPGGKTTEGSPSAQNKDESNAHSANIDSAPKVEVSEGMNTETAEALNVKPDPSKGVPPNTPLGSPTASRDESFLSDAEGNGSIAEAIGRTLDVCVSAIEEAMDDVEKVDASPSELKASVGKEIALDAFSVASSMVSGMTDALQKVEDPKKEENAPSIPSSASESVEDASKSDVPSVASGATGATILKSEGGTHEEDQGDATPANETSSFGEDEWSVVSDEKAKAKQDAPKQLDCRLLAKWDSELHQLHELGFLDDGKNLDVLEALEASHVAVDSTEKVTINAALGRLLGDR